MNYWLALHYSCREDEDEREWYWIYLKRRRDDLNVDDLVFIYETETHPNVIQDGRPITRPRGRKAVVALVRVKSEVREHDAHEVLEDGRRHNWSFVAETDLERPCNISIAELRRALQKPGWSGRASGGLIQLKPTQFNRILALCR